MASLASRAHAGKPKALSEPDRTLLIWVVAVTCFVTGLLTALAIGSSWLNPADADKSSAVQPNWVSLDTIRATSGDGEVVKARMALDAPDPDTRAWLRNRPHQVALLLQISVAEYENGDAAGAERVQRLGADTRSRLNKFLVAHHVPPVRDVVVQDLVYSTP